MPFSYHSHSGQFCGHADGALEEVSFLSVRLCFVSVLSADALVCFF